MQGFTQFPLKQALSVGHSLSDAHPIWTGGNATKVFNKNYYYRDIDEIYVYWYEVENEESIHIKRNWLNDDA